MSFIDVAKKNLIYFLGKCIAIRHILKKRKKRQDIEYFDEVWKERIKIMCLLIANDEKIVIDIGCGKMRLKEFLLKDVKYIGVDYKDRG